MMERVSFRVFRRDVFSTPHFSRSLLVKKFEKRGFSQIEIMTENSTIRQLERKFDRKSDDIAIECGHLVKARSSKANMCQAYNHCINMMSLETNVKDWGEEHA